MTSVRRYAVDNRDGWVLDVKRVTADDGADPDLSPILFVPGYGMNTHILGYHPRGTSMVDFLCDAGFEVWLANLRGQGQSSRRDRGSKQIGMGDLSHVDLPIVVERVLELTESKTGRLHMIGCSLGAALAYSYLASVVDDHVLASLTSLGGPFRWDRVHPVIAAAAKQARWISKVPIMGTRQIAKLVVPLVSQFPILLSPYMNANRIDLSNAGHLALTVDDPPPGVTRELGEWISNRHLVVNGIDVGQVLENIELPILCVVATKDGIVPRESIVAIREVAAGPVEVLECGDHDNHFAHADLFINDEAEERVFRPMRDWLTAVD